MRGQIPEAFGGLDPDLSGKGRSPGGRLEKPVFRRHRDVRSAMFCRDPLAFVLQIQYTINPKYELLTYDE